MRMRVAAKCTVGLALALAAAAPAARAQHGGGEDEGETALRVLGHRYAYKPLVGYTIKGLRLTAPFSAATRLEGLGGYPVDRDLTPADHGAAFDLRLRVGATLDSGAVLAPVNLAVVYEHDLVTGALSGEPDLEGEGYTNGEPVQTQVRNAYLRASVGRELHFLGGLMTSHWGLGLVANDGAHGWHPGTAHFADPRGGDRVLRLMLASGPLTPVGITVALGHDWVQHDDALLEGDEARQIVGSVMLGRGMPTSLGFYMVYREQQSELGEATDVGVMDLYARTEHALAHELRLTAEVEAALIVGQTTLGATTYNPERDILQAAAAVRVGLARSAMGWALDLLFASGDADLDDRQQNNFSADPNYALSLFLYRYVLSGQTARAPYTAGDPGLVGYPAGGLDRLPTRERATNTAAIFPRMWWRPTRGLEVYGGPLLAFTLAPLADPFNTRLAGGEARNALDGKPGSYLGVELDVGARFRMLLFGTELTTGVELGVFSPDAALKTAEGKNMDAVGGGRLLVTYNF